MFLRLSFQNQNQIREPAPNRESWIQLHVSFVTRQVSSLMYSSDLKNFQFTSYIYQLDAVINEESLYNIFEQFGEIADLTIKRHQFKTVSQR